MTDNEPSGWETLRDMAELDELPPIRHHTVWSAPIGGELLFANGEPTALGRAMLSPEMIERLKAELAPDHELRLDTSPLITLDASGITVKLITDEPEAT